jgi:hypothetical protein
MSYTSGEFASQVILIFITKAQRILNETISHLPQNTNLAYNPKEEEFLSYCRQKYGGDLYRETVTEDKTFSFLYFQAYRQPKKRGRKKR